MQKILTIFFCLFVVQTIYAQNGSITGKVLDEEGLALPGANVIVLNTELGAATDTDGNYVIRNIPSGTYSVRAQFVGYDNFTIENVVVEAGKSTEVNFDLVSGIISGDEIVVVGYGIQQKRDVTGSATNIDVDDIQKIPTTSVGNAIQGAAAGVNVSHSTGAPGESPQIIIRGTGSLGGNDPLYIVDGVPTRINYVNPSDIESINILKDASMAAIYGSRASNGVIIINTKRGETKGKDSGEIQVRYNSYFGVNSIEDEFPFITNADDYVKVARNALENAGLTYPDDHFIALYDADPSSLASSDWQNEYFRNANEHKHDLSISGGTDNFNFAVMGMFSDMEGLVIGTENKRMSLRLNSDYKKGIFRIGESVSFGRSEGGGRYQDAYSFYKLTRISPITPIYDNTESGFGSQMNIIGLDNQGVNPILQNTLIQNTWDNIQVMLSGYLEVDILENLKYTFRLSQNINNNYSFYYFPSYYSNDIDNTPSAEMSETRSREYHNILESFVNYNLEISDHKLEAMLGFAQETKDWRSTYGYAKGFASNDLQVLGAGEASDDASGYALEWKLRSYFGRINYSYLDRYLVTVNMRRDGSSRFDEGNRWGNFPSFSAAWRLSKESFFNVPFITDLKLRGGYGELGLQEFNDYQYIPKIEIDQNGRLNYPFGDGRDQSIYIGARSLNFPSTGIKWETSKETNVGLDFGMFNDKLSLNMDYYLRTSEGILFEVPIPLSAGVVSPPTVNSASIDNSGLELAINYRNFDSDFKYQIAATVSTYSNEVTKMGEFGNESIVGGEIHWGLESTTKTVVGKPIASFYLYETDGLFANQAEIDAYAKNGDLIMPDAMPGDLKYVDINGDGVITVDDKKFMGDAIPDVEFGLNFNASYSNFDVTLNLFASLGKDMINGARWLTMNSDKFHAMHEDVLDSWTETNTDTDIPRFVYGDERNLQASDIWLEDASYLRIKLLEIGYTIPKNLTSSWGIDGLRVYVAAENLLTITGYSGYDPSISTYEGGNIFDRGADRSPFPVGRKFLTGIQINL
jgi:TonB-dependent starch-binding outer membrane protein SusC